MVTVHVRAAAAKATNALKSAAHAAAAARTAPIRRAAPVIRGAAGAHDQGSDGNERGRHHHRPRRACASNGAHR